MNALDKDDDHEFRTPLTTLAAANEAGAKEQKRLKDRVPPTLLDPGETVIVPHWEVSRIWNYAMKAYMGLEALGHGSTVYGETSGWDIAEGFLKCSCPQIGFLSTRDKGSWPCDFCGKVESNLKQCSTCKKAQCE